MQHSSAEAIFRQTQQREFFARIESDETLNFFRMMREDADIEVLQDYILLHGTTELDTAIDDCRNAGLSFTEAMEAQLLIAKKELIKEYVGVFFSECMPDGGVIPQSLLDLAKEEAIIPYLAEKVLERYEYDLLQLSKVLLPNSLINEIIAPKGIFSSSLLEPKYFGDIRARITELKQNLTGAITFSVVEAIKQENVVEATGILDSQSKGDFLLIPDQDGKLLLHHLVILEQYELIKNIFKKFPDTKAEMLLAQDITGRTAAHYLFNPPLEEQAVIPANTDLLLEEEGATHVEELAAMEASEATEQKASILDKIKLFHIMLGKQKITDRIQMMRQRDETNNSLFFSWYRYLRALPQDGTTSSFLWPVIFSLGYHSQILFHQQERQFLTLTHPETQKPYDKPKLYLEMGLGELLNIITKELVKNKKMYSIPHLELLRRHLNFFLDTLIKDYAMDLSALEIANSEENKADLFSFGPVMPPINKSAYTKQLQESILKAKVQTILQQTDNYTDALVLAFQDKQKEVTLTIIENIMNDSAVTSIPHPTVVISAFLSLNETDRQDLFPELIKVFLKEDLATEMTEEKGTAFHMLAEKGTEEEINAFLDFLEEDQIAAISLTSVSSAYDGLSPFLLLAKQPDQTTAFGRVKTIIGIESADAVLKEYQQREDSNKQIVQALIARGCLNYKGRTKAAPPPPISDEYNEHNQRASLPF